MSRLTASPPPAISAVSTQVSNTPAISRKPKNMDKLFSIVSAAQSAPAFAQSEETNHYILPSFADNYEAWAYPDTQLPILDEWFASTATPPSTAIASPDMGQNALFSATAPPQFTFAASSGLPSLSPPSSNLSADNSPLLANGLSLSLAGTSAATTPAAMSPQQQGFMLSGGLTVADYAAALFPEIAVSLSSVLTSPAPEPAVTPRRSASLESLQLPFGTDISRLFSSASSPSELTTGEKNKPAMVSKGRVIKTAAKPKAKPRVRAATKVSNPSSNEAAYSSADVDGLSAEEQRKRRDTEFLASLPQQLALKRRRTSNTKQKERILAELMGEKSGSESQTPELDVDVCDVVVAEVDADEHSLDAVAALKRKKNTDAARRSRMRKILRIETLETRVSELETENSNLSQLVADMEAERAVMAQRMEEYERHLGAQAGTKPSFMA